MIVKYLIQIMINTDKCWCEFKNTIKHHVCKKDYIWNPSTCNCQFDKYLKWNIGDSVNITCDKIIEPTKTNVINLNNEEATFKMDNFCFTSIFINHNVTAANHLYLLLHRNTNENKNMYYHIVISINMENNNHLTEIHICVCYYF